MHLIMRGAPREMRLRPYDALSAALLHLYEEVRSENAKRAKRGAKLAYGTAVAAVDRVLFPDLLSTVIGLDEGCRVRVRSDVEFGSECHQNATRGRLGTVSAIGAHDDVEVWLDPVEGAAGCTFTYPRDALQPLIGLNGDVLRDPRTLRLADWQLKAMADALALNLGAENVSADVAARLLRAASGILNANPAAAPVGD
ncbi:hypothetical protein D7S63_20470 [Ralstonia pickettii]|nr:hypothetical protein [Ralstonia pickettii]MBA9913629.1 hypothetical protein [Ralstonia insidiosa]MBA9894089.1 hypothetical protein [Ralstonia pickettii]MBB0094538.1 hypothetical protein [Ralstonia pickettii]MBB0159171.1 hypothetical protein [Ralstonia pickettii]